MNIDRIRQAFRDVPMCAGKLAKNNKDGHAMCALGALLVSAGVATPNELVNSSTTLRVAIHMRTLRNVYGFQTMDQVFDLIRVNDEVNDEEFKGQTSSAIKHRLDNWLKRGEVK